jgi:hypothetical protein
MGRQILRKYRQANGRGETRICFVRITPDQEIFTYMVGYPVWEISRRMAAGVYLSALVRIWRSQPGSPLPPPLARTGA